MMRKVILLALIVLIIPLIHCYGQQEERDRYTSEDLISTFYEEDFRPFHKGVWFTKLSFQLSDQSLQNVSRLFDQVVEGKDFSWNLNLAGGAFVSNYFMVGATVGFDESRFTGDVINSDSDTVAAQSISRLLTLAPYLRLAIPLSKNQRLSFYNDVGISFGYGRSLVRDITNMDEIDKEFGDQFLFGIGMTPGVTFFLVRNFALEAGINIIGYRLNIENVTDGDGVETQKVEHDVTFRINLLSLNLGLAYFFGTKK